MKSVVRTPYMASVQENRHFHEDEQALYWTAISLQSPLVHYNCHAVNQALERVRGEVRFYFPLTPFHFPPNPYSTVTLFARLRG